MTIKLCRQCGSGPLLKRVKGEISKEYMQIVCSNKECKVHTAPMNTNHKVPDGMTVQSVLSREWNDINKDGL
jgi:hypothetical protein